MSSTESDASHLINNEWHDNTSLAGQTPLEFFDSDASDDGEHEHEHDMHTSDYSTRMEELFEEGEEDADHHADEDDEEEEEGFLYTGADADVSTGYHDQLRDVLEHDFDEEDDETETHEVEKSLILNNPARIDDDDDEPLQHADALSDHTPSTSSMGPITPPSRTMSPSTSGAYLKLARPFLHPTVSRLRSYTPQASRTPSNASGVTSHSHLFEGASPLPSHFSSMSRMSSVSNLQASTSSQRDTPSAEPPSHPEREVFKWTELQNITRDIYSPKAQKLSSVLGSSPARSPTVLAANGLICIGTDAGKIYVYDFKQTLKCICGNDSTASTCGPITALALSHDHTCVASGHATGHVQIFDLKNPKMPVRSVAPTTLAVVASGRKEGHLQGSRIVSIGFVGGRHTALVSADENGLAFFHSLGKVLFVEASDILRILGRYPDDASAITSPQKGLDPASLTVSDALSRRRRARYTILTMAALPLGASPHPTDTYNVIALLTPTKLVVVGLKPTPRTWFKCPRGADEGGPWRSKSKWKGTMAWFPSVLLSPSSRTETIQVENGKNGKEQIGTPTIPLLVYTWGRSLRCIKISESKIKQTMRSSKTGKTREIEVGTIVYEDVGKWSAEDDILAAQWLNANQLVVLTASTLGVYDVHLSKLIDRVPFDGLSLVSPTLAYTVNGTIPYADAVGDIAHSVRVYKGKIFLLGRSGLQVGTLLTWADRILSFVQDGNFLGAIDLARSYYVGEAPGNRNGLPDDPQLYKQVIGERIQHLMVASARYAFSEDRMTDGTHVTPDGRGVDRTSLFEDLVSVCCRASVALDDFEFLFEDLFQQYDDSGISSIYLRQLEPFVLNNSIRYVPPRITQRLVGLHEENGRPGHVERIIWHIDPACLDINQTIHLCQKHHLYDALIYVYTRALRDYVAPVVDLLSLIRRVQQYRKSRLESAEDSGTVADMDTSMEPIIINAYKIYPYLANVLSGLTYPSEEPLPEEEAFQAKKDVYAFLFFGRSSVWPPGEGGKLVLTSDEEGGVEPTYPYARQLLRFDSESFLHSLDIAFEDAYLNDKSRNVSRLIIVRILLEILSSGDLPPEDVTFVNIFVARNVPKYPQFLEITSTALHNILVGLAQDPDPQTREDRQLAAEYLLSVYNPHESDRIIHLFETARFYRILRSWYYQDQRWPALLSTYLDDESLRSSEKLAKVGEVLVASTRANQGALSDEVITTISNSLSQLLQANAATTAFLIDKHMPQLHERALEAFGDGPDAEHSRFLYLHYLLGPPGSDDDEYATPVRDSAPSLQLPGRLRQLYIALQCRYEPRDVIKVLKYLPADILNWAQVLEACESNGAFDAVVWATNWRGDPQEALSKAESFQRQLTLKIVDSLSGQDPSEDLSHVPAAVASLKAIGEIGMAICIERSQASSVTEVPLEDIWFKLLSSQINCVQLVSASQGEVSQDQEASADSSASNLSGISADEFSSTLSSLRSLVQTTFGALVSITSTRAVSFPRLFKRLVNSAPPSTGTHYTEFRIILTGMLESYRSDGDMLIITKHLVDRDLYDTVAEISRERARGWAAGRGTCSYCRKPLLDRQLDASHDSPNQSHTEIIASRTGIIYHRQCLPSRTLIL